MPAFQPHMIISGGQTGADIGGLVGAERVGIATGGTAPRNYLTEKGPQPEALKHRFHLTMHPSSDYKPRTIDNVKNADAVLIFSVSADSNGTLLTIDTCEALNKPYCVVDPFQASAIDIASSFLNREKPKVLNVAGNRESVCKGIASRVASIIESLFKE